MKNSTFILKLLIVICAVSCALALTACDVGNTHIGVTTKTLSAPTNLYIEDGVLYWNPVEYAVGYMVKVGNTEKVTNETQYSLTYLKDGTYSVSVKAMGDGVLYASSAYGESISYNRENDTGNEYTDEVKGAFGSFDEINTRSSYLGYGIDIINSNAITSKNVLATYPIFNMDKLMGETLLKSNEHYNTFEAIEGETIQSFTNSMSLSTSITSGSSVSAKGKVGGGTVGGSASLSRGLQGCFTTTSSRVESQYFLEIVAENQSYWLILQSSEQRYKELLSDEFKADLYNKSMTPAQLFLKYGTHLLTSVAMGGNICMYYTLYSYERNVELSTYAKLSTEIKANVEASYGSAQGSASTQKDFSLAYTYTQSAKEYGIQVDKFIISAGGGSFGISTEANLYSNYYDWQKSLDTNPVIIGIKDANSLYAIWDLLDLNVAGAADRYNELRNYFMQYGSESYNELCERYEIAKPVYPTDINNISVGGNPVYNETDMVHVIAGKTYQIEFDVTPENANRYTKTYALSVGALTAEEVAENYGEIDASGVLKLKNTIESGSFLNVTVSAGAVSKQIRLYVEQTYTVVFNNGGVGWINVAPLYGVKDSSFIEEPTIEKEGYVVEWYRDRECKVIFDFESDRIYGNTTLYAKSVAITPTVTFDSGEGSKVDSQTIAYNANVGEPSAPTLTGYTFAGWYLDRALTQSFDFTTGVTKDTTLYAKWVKIVYTVKFQSNGGTPVADQTTDISAAYKLTECTPTRTYYDFVGWYKDEYFTQYFDFNMEITADCTLYAKWSAVKVTVNVAEKDGGKVYDEYGFEIGAKTTSIEEQFIINVPQPAKEGHTFVGWYYLGQTYTDASEMLFTPTAATEFTICALWSVNHYHLTYKIDDTVVYSEEVAFGAEIEHYVPQTKTGYDVSAWVGEPSTMPARDVTVTAKYIPINYAVEYYVDGILYTTQYYHYENAISYPTAPTESGKVFSGWTYANGALPTVMPAQNIKIDGVFDIAIYTVTYYLDGEKYAEEDVWKNTAIPDRNVERVGYSFSGWLYNGSPIGLMPAKNISVYGTTTINEYTLTVEYKTEDNASVPTKYVKEFYYGAEYSVASPGVSGYSVDTALVSGIMPANDVTVIVNYSLNQYTLTVKYTFEDNGLTKEDTIRNYKYKDNYYAEVTGYSGYTPDKSAVEGKMPANNVTVTVNYALNEYSLTIYYKYKTDQSQAYTTYTGKYKYSKAYGVDAPVLTGYTADKSAVSGTMPASNMEFTVYYTPKTTTITYDLNASSILTTPTISAGTKTVSYNSSATLGVPSAAYYRFLGWYTAKNGGTQITTDSGVFVTNVSGYISSAKWHNEASAVTLYAHYEQTKAGYTYINSASELESIRNNPSGKYMLIADINLNNAIWTPISSFSGTLDGNGKNIYNFKINIDATATTNAAFIVQLSNSGRIEKLTLKNASIKGKITGNEKKVYQLNICGLVSSNYGVIDSCTLTDVEINGIIHANKDYIDATDQIMRIGGLVAHNQQGAAILNSKIYHCTVNGHLEAEKGKGIDSDGVLGGICAVNYGKIDNCSVLGNCSMYLDVDGNGESSGNHSYVKARFGGVVGIQSGQNAQLLSCEIGSGTYKCDVSYGSWSNGYELCAKVLAWYESGTKETSLWKYSECNNMTRTWTGSTNYTDTITVPYCTGKDDSSYNRKGG